ncbi:hypothetical protein ACN47E_010164 [Coniothyrium glycines]
MFPTFDVPPLHAETVGARRARRAKEDVLTRRSSSATSQSSGSTRSANANPRSLDKTGFGWFGKSSKKGVQEIAVLPSKKPQPCKSPPHHPHPPPHPHVRHSHSRHPERDTEPDTAPDTAPDNDPVFTQHFPQPPPLTSLPLPLPPPSSALPVPPSPGLLSTSERKSHYSTYSHVSSYPTTVSSDRTTRSSRSVFSTTSGYDDSIPEETLGDSRHATTNAQLEQFEPVERRARPPSRQGDHGPKLSQGPFARALAKMEGAGARIVTARLSEEWEGLDDDESYQEVVFEKRLWALTAYQRLTQNKPLQSPAHDVLSASRPADQRRLLHLNGSLADGWVLATRYPAVTVYTLSSKKSSSVPTSYPAPLNHHSLYVPSFSSASPFPNNYFDAIVSRSIATTLRNDEWARSFFDCMRILKPGGQIEILSVDAHMSCEGPKLSSWVEQYLSNRLDAHDLSCQASDTVLDTMEIVGLENIRRARLALPVHSPKAIARPAPPPSHTFGAAMPVPSPQDSIDASKMMAFLGRHIYQDLYSSLLQHTHGEEWFWMRKDIKDECERYKTKMVLNIACAQKPTTNATSESYLDL